MLHSYRAVRKIEKLNNNGGDIYIRCAGFVGQQMLFEFEKLGVEVTAFLDNSWKEVNQISGIPVLSPEIIYEKEKGTYFIVIAIQNNKVFEDIAHDYEAHGLKLDEDYGDISIEPEYRVGSFRDIRPNFDFENMFITGACDRLSEMHDIDDAFNKVLPKCYNVIPNLDLPLTTYCSLQCRYCSHCIPETNSPKHFEVERIISDLEILLENSYIACLAIMGGEPFVYPQLSEFIKAYKIIKHKENIGFTRVVTNGTIVPDDVFFEEFSGLDNAYIYISNYGEKSRKIDELIKKCDEFGIKTYVCPFTDEWLSLGDYRLPRNYSDEEMKQLYAVCGSHMCVQLLNGHIYSCGRTPILNEDHLIPFFENDFCDVRRADKETLAERLHTYLYEKTFLEGCRYCDGQHLYSKKICRGE